MRFLVLLALVSAAYALPRREARSVGGSPTTIEQYPYMSNMMRQWWGVFWSQACSGALLTSRTVLLGAHCIFGETPINFNVRLGSNISWTGGHLHEVSQFIIHEDYVDLTYENDVAIIVLATPAILSDTVTTARIVSRTFLLPAGSVLTALGWGLTPAGGGSTEELQHLNLNIIDQEYCAHRYIWPVVTDGMVCVGILGVDGQDFCRADGPLTIMGDVIYGIHSWSYSCGHEFLPGVSTRVAYYSDWIVEYGAI